MCCANANATRRETARQTLINILCTPMSGTLSKAYYEHVFKPAHGGHNRGAAAKVSKASEAACTCYGYVHITIGSVWMEFTAKLNRAGECF